MTGRPGVPDNGNDWRKFRAVPRSYPLRSLLLYFVLIGVETEGLLDYQGRAGDHFHCAVEPSPGVEISIPEGELEKYIFMAEASFSAYAFGFLQGKTAHFSHFEAKKGKGKKQKGRPKLVVLFLVEKCTFSPVLSNFLTKT